MPPKRKPLAQNTKVAKRSRISDEGKSDKMAARKLNGADLHEELQGILENQGEKVSTNGITYISVAATSSVMAPLESEDPLAPLDLTMDSAKADAIDETVSFFERNGDTEKILLTQEDRSTGAFLISEFEIYEQNDTQDLFVNEQDNDILGKVLLEPPYESQDPEDKCVPQRPVKISHEFEHEGQTEDEIPEIENRQDDTQVALILTEVVNQQSTSQNLPPAHDELEAKCKRLEAENKHLADQLRKCKRKLAKVEEGKLSSDDYALRLGKELQMLKDKQKIPQARFTEEDGIHVTVQDLEELNDRAPTDSMFVGLLTTRLIGADKLVHMSVTGQASHRYAKMTKPDGTPLYPNPEKMDPNILEFICNKVAERTALRIGPENAKTIRKLSESTVVKRYIAQKIGNLKKAALERTNRSEGQLKQSAVNVRV